MLQAPAGLSRVRAALASLASWPTTAARWFVWARWLQVSLIVLLGVVLRFWGVFHGWREDFIYHPDAGPLTVPDAWGLYARDQWVGPVLKTTAPLYMFLHAVAIRAVAWLAGFLAIPVQWTMPFVAAIGSGLSAALGALTVLVVYGIGRLGYGHAAGSVAALLLAVSPLHGLHSRYPYPDVAMTFFLALALLASAAVLRRPTVLPTLFGAGLAGAAAATKVGGIAAAPPVVLALFLGWRRRVGTLWALGVSALLALAVGLGLQGFTFGGYQSLGEVFARFGSEVAQVWHRADLPDFGEQFRMIVSALRNGYEAPMLLLGGASVVVAGWRRTGLDWVFLALLGSLGLVLLRLPVPDDRFLVPVTLALAVLGGRAVGEGLRISRGRALPVLLILAVLTGTALPALHRAVRQGLFLALPDTRYLAGLWVEAHVPPSMRMAIEGGYWPLGVNERQGAVYVDATRPLAEQADGFDLLVTSSLEHGRYVERPERYPRIAAFFRELPRSAHLVRSFELLPMGFTHSTIKVWWPSKGPLGPTVRLYLPRPFDDSWNGGVSWLDEAPYDRDDRSWWIRGGYHRSVWLVSGRPFETLGVLLRNGTEPSRVRVRTGLTARSRWLAPYGRTLVTFHPASLTWQPPYLAHLRVSVDSGDGVLVQVRRGVREIGETYWAWGEWPQAIPWLRQAVEDDPADPEVVLLLASAYARSGQAGAAREALGALGRLAPDLLARYRALAAEEGEAFDRLFAEVTGLNPAILRFSLATTFEAEALPRLAGEVEVVDGASGDRAVALPAGDRPSPQVVTYGPYAYLPWGAYRAVFRVRGLGGPGRGSAALEVQAGPTLLARSTVPAARLPRDRFAEIAVPFRHSEPDARVEFRVVAHGPGGLAVDSVRLEPDLRELARMKLGLLEEIQAFISPQRLVSPACGRRPSGCMPGRPLISPGARPIMGS